MRISHMVGHGRRGGHLPGICKQKEMDALGKPAHDQDLGGRGGVFLLAVAAMA